MRDSNEMRLKGQLWGRLYRLRPPRGSSREGRWIRRGKILKGVSSGRAYLDPLWAREKICAHKLGPNELRGRLREQKETRLLNPQ